MVYNFTSMAAEYKATLDTSNLTDVCSASTFVAFLSLLNVWLQDSEIISGAAKCVNPIEKVDPEYDFVIIGGGASGAAVAARLSEIHDWKVLLLEAGSEAPLASLIPAFGTKFLTEENMWNYTTINEEHACLSTGGSCAWPSGKNLAGNTAHNWMIYLRGNPTDYNNWAAAGNEGWTWEEVEPFFIKGEDNGDIEMVGRKHHGTGGPLSVERYPYCPPIVYAILNASDELGYGISEDLNGDTLTGFSINQATNKKGVRCNSATAYLRPAIDRPNLHVSLNSLVTRVIIENDRAVGVEYYKDGEYRTVYSTREVIVSGGPVGSPHILLLSGLGPKDHLESVDIEVTKDIPGVGNNLQDHTAMVISYTVTDPDAHYNNWDVLEEYLTDQTGSMSSSGAIQVLALLASNVTASDYPDLEIFVKGYLAECAPTVDGAVESTDQHTVEILASLLHPKSTGTVTLASKDPFELPLIWANYYSVSDDIDRMLDGVKIIQALVQTKALHSYNFTLSGGPLAACADFEFKSDEYWICVIKQDNYALYHQVGTCKMGPASDSMAVVDPRLRVHGIEGLRVVDSSIMPKVPSGNTQASSMMVGERGAHFIKEDWNQISGEETHTLTDTNRM